MVKLRNFSLPPAACEKLKEWQDAVDAISDYAVRVAEAKRQFGQRNKPDNAVFRVVRYYLQGICSGAARCVYCEDSMADEVEHIRPKDLYPEVVFVWDNYIYACGPCNGRKNNKFAVFVVGSGVLLEVTRKSNAPVIPPARGQMVFINPRRDDGLKMMELELETGWLFPAGRGNSKKHQRAKYTIETLGLNTREKLLKARADAYRDYCALLCEYIKRRDDGALPAQLTDLINFLKGRQHPTVWAEMKRQHSLIKELNDLFIQAPEALNW